MSATLMRTAPVLRAAARASGAVKPMAMASTSFVRGKATLPDLSCKVHSILPLASPWLTSALRL